MSDADENDSEDQESNSESGSEESDNQSFDNSAVDTDIPLWQRLNNQTMNEDKRAASQHKHIKKKKPKSSDRDLKIKRTKKNKNAPSEMPSNKPVRRLRVTGDNSTKQFRDPRFSNISGKLDNDIFFKTYEFLDAHQKNEIEQMAKQMKKVKSDATRDIIKDKLTRSKQELTERKRYLRVSDRLKKISSEEKEKVARGKKPFYLKDTDKKAIALEERYLELKSEGKLQTFMNKKRKHNSNKDHKLLPRRRLDGDGGGTLTADRDAQVTVIAIAYLSNS